ncbi:hypothetical protein [Xanthomonas axonopodis]
MSLVQTSEAIDKLEQALQSKKADLLAHLRLITEKRAAGTLALRDILDLQMLGANYFNEAENIVGKSALMEADHTGEWATNFAENCHEILKSLIDYRITLVSTAHEVGLRLQPPGELSYAAMQRIVRKYLSKSTWKTLKREMENQGLPTAGFKSKNARDKIPTGSIFYVATAIVGAVTILITSLAIPNPSEFQLYIFKAIFSISIAALGSFVPGFIGINIKYKSPGMRLALTAGGALAIFVLLLGYNPN